MRYGTVVRLGMLLMSVAWSQSLFGQFQTPSNEELKMTSDPKAPGASAVYLYREETADDPHHFRIVYARIKVLTEQGKEAATVHITYQKNFTFSASGNNSSRMGAGANHWDTPDAAHLGEDMPWDTETFNVRTDISALEARTIHADGTVVSLTGAPADLLRVKKGHNQVNDYTFTLPAVQVGDILEYRYQVRYDRFEQAPEWQVQQPLFVHHAHFAFTPAERFLPERNKNQGTAAMDDSALTDIHGESMTDIRSAAVLPAGKAVKLEASGRYTLDLTDVPAIPEEAFSPPLEGQIYHVSFFYTATPNEKEFWQKEMDYWNRALNQYIASTPELQHAAAEMFAPGDSALDKARKIYSLVSKLENTDFNTDGEPGVGSDWVPAGHVDGLLDQKRGSSNQIAYLYLALAKIAGLSPRAERIASRSHRIFSPTVLRTDQLDTVVVALSIDGKDITIDPGTSMAPFETLHWAHAGAAGVALINGRVESVITPLQQKSDNMVARVGTLNVSAQGGVSGSLKIAFIGQEAIQLRQIGIRSSPEVVARQIDRLLAAEVPAGVQAKVDHVSFLDDPSKQLLAVVNVSGTLASQTGSRLILPRVFFETRESNPFPAEEGRTTPIDVQFPTTEQEQIKYVLPAGLALEGAPQDASLKFNDSAVYQLRSKVVPGSITNIRVLARTFTLLDAAQYGQLRNFYGKVVSADQQQVVLNAASAGSGQ